MTSVRRLTTRTVGWHPTRTSQWPKPGSQLRCYSTVITLVGPDQVVVSMNGTAVFTAAEWRDYVRQVGKTLMEESNG